MRYTLLTFGLLAGMVTFARAADEPAKATAKPIDVVKIDRKEPVLYEKDIEPILVNKCLVCHSGPVKEAKLDLSTYEALMKGGKRGKNTIPGKSAESLLVKLCGKTDKPLMPPKGEEPLSPTELALFKLWIDQGAKAPTGVRERPKAVVSLPPAQVTPVRALAISPDKKFVVASRGNQIHLYDAAAGTHVRSFLDPNLTTADKKPVQAPHITIVESLAYSPDGKLIASGAYQEVVIWEAETGNVKQKLTGFVDRVVALAFSADGKLLATGGGAPTEDGEIKVFEVEGGKQLLDIKNGHSDTVFGVSFSPDGTKLATCGADKFVKCFEIPSGKFIKSFEGHTHHVLDVGWKSDGKILASGGADNVVKVWDFEKGEQVRTINAAGKQITRLLFIGATPQIVTCSGDATVRFFNVDNGGSVRNFAGNTDFLYAVGVSADGTLVAAGGEEGVVRLYNGTNGTVLKTLVPPGVEQPMPPKK